MVASCVTIALVDAWVVAAITAAAPTRAIPTISAPAVFAVRRGLRVTFPRASGPTGRQAANGSAATRRNPRASTGDAASTPRTTAPAPIPSTAPARSAVGFSSASTTAATPSTTSTIPTTARRVRERSGRVTSSRSASTGGTSAARRAGSAAASTLTEGARRARRRPA